MAFDLESFSEECHGLPKAEIVRKITEKIKDLKAMARAKRKNPPISQEINFVDIDKADIKTLERMANYISGQSLLRIKFTANELKLVDKILEKMR